MFILTSVKFIRKSCTLTNNIICFRQFLSDKQQFTHYMQKYHESSIALLKHFGWRREARVIGWELAKFLLYDFFLLYSLLKYGLHHQI